MLTDHEIAGMYGEEYFTECSETCGAHGPGAYMELVEAGRQDRANAAARLDRLLVGALGKRGSYCEVGCGPGYFLAEMRGRGWSVRGLDISEFASRHAKEQFDLEVMVGSLEPGVLPPETFEASFLGDVLEHLPRPREALGSLREALKPGGIVAVAVPSTLNLLSGKIGMLVYRVRGRAKTLRIPPYHLFEYTPRTLRRMLEESGFEVLSIRQSAVPLHRMGLRGTKLENAGKVALQVVAHTTSRLFNRGGDRLLALARKPAG